MCTVSMIGDHYADKWRQYPPQPSTVWPHVFVPAPVISREEFDALRRDVEDMKALLIRAKRYDDGHGEPDCEMDEKLAVLRRVADLVGVDLSDVFALAPPSPIQRVKGE